MGPATHAGIQLWLIKQHLAEASKMSGGNTVVGVKEQQMIETSKFDAFISGKTGTSARLLHEPKTPIVACELLDDTRRVINRSIVDNDRFPIRKNLAAHGTQSFCEGVGGVACRNNY
jgi:predicted RNA binding protein with dsRBD fold (UPF0201 family)